MLKTSSLYSTPYMDQQQYVLFSTSISGGLANAFSRTCIAPLERIRLQLAVDSSQHANGFTCLKHIVQQEGIAGLWAGNVLNTIRIFPQGMVAFSIKDGLPLLFPESIRHTKTEKCISGLLSGIISLSIVYPLDFLRIRMTTSPNVYRNWHQALRTVYQESGFRGLYNGVSYGNLWAGPYYLIQFSSYDFMKSQWLKRNPDHLTLPPYIGLLFGCLAGIICVAAVYPLESTRRKLQVQGIGGRPKVYTSWWNCFTKTIKDHGYVGLYRGLCANLVKAPLSIGIVFATYETLMKYAFNVNKDSLCAKNK